MATTKVSLRVSGMIAEALRIYRSNANTLLILAALVIVPTNILLGLLIGFTLPGDVFDPLRGAPDATELRHLAIALPIGLAIGIIGQTLAIGACFHAVKEAHSGRTPVLRESVAYAWERLGSLLWLAIITTILLVLAFLALVIPAIYFGIAWSVAMPVLLAEGLKGTKALGRSRVLVKGNWGPAAGVYIVGGIAVAIVGWIVDRIFGVGPTSVSFAEGLTMRTLADSVTGVIGTPFTAALAAILYFELKKLADNAALEGAAPPPTPPDP